MTKDQRVKSISLRHQDDRIRQENIELSEQIEYCGRIAESMNDKVMRNAELMEHNIIKRFEIQDEIKSI